MGVGMQESDCQGFDAVLFELWNQTSHRLFVKRPQDSTAGGNPLRYSKTQPTWHQRLRHIEERAVVVDGEVVVRPMMYLALSYDHRLIDGREAVQFLVAIKGMIEDPARILLEL